MHADNPKLRERGLVLNQRERRAERRTMDEQQRLAVFGAGDDVLDLATIDWGEIRLSARLSIVGASSCRDNDGKKYESCSHYCPPLATTRSQANFATGTS